MLSASRSEILDCETKIQKDQEALAALPGIQETLKRYREAGVEEKLKSQNLIIKAEGVVEAAKEGLSPFTDVTADLAALFPVSQEFLADETLEGLPAQAELASLRGTFSTFERAAKDALKALQTAAETAQKEISGVSIKVASEKTATQADYAYARWCGRGRRATAAPMPIVGHLVWVKNYASSERFVR
jgi:hypothetical protein